MIGLTKQQQQILDFILKWQRTEGATPSRQEIADHFGFRSPNSVTGHLRLMRQKGFLESDAGKARSLRVTSSLAKLRSRIADILLPMTLPRSSTSAPPELPGCTGTLI
jgi:SOS-response transcriptional repressor LexA